MKCGLLGEKLGHSYSPQIHRRLGEYSQSLFEKNSDDLEYFSARLIRELKKYRLYDAKVWVPQALALVDHKEMVEITHNLVTRRQKLRNRMEYSMNVIKTQREDVDKLMCDVKVLKPEIQEIIASIDALNGALQAPFFFHS